MIHRRKQTGKRLAAAILVMAMAVGVFFGGFPAGQAQAAPESGGSTTVTKDITGYILPDSDKKEYKIEELMSLTSQQLRLARNEIYARHGRLFANKEVQAYFDRCTWYVGVIPADAFDANTLSVIETRNIETIKKAELLKETATTTPVTDYILPDSSTKELTEADLAGLTAEQLRIARNEIYARHGRKFADKDLQAYFDALSWYSGTIAPESFDPSVLSEIEVKNIATIEKVEAAKSAPAIVDPGYVLPDSDKRLYTAEELAGLTSGELRIARNEIYARHGRRFNDPEIQAYFDSCSWYKGTIAPASFDPKVFTYIEQANIRLIQQMEGVSVQTISWSLKNTSNSWAATDGTLVFSNSLEYPVFSGTSPAVAVLNARYNEIAASVMLDDSDVDTFKAMALKYADASTLPWYDYLSTAVTYNKNGVVSTLEEYEHYNGGSSTVYYESGLTVDLNTGAVLSLSNLIQGTEEELKSVLSHYYMTTLGAYPNDFQMETLREYSAYCLTDAGLVIYYNVGSTITRAEIVIPYTNSGSAIISAPTLLAAISGK